MAPEAPPFEITAALLALVSEIERLVGRAEGLGGQGCDPQLRKQRPQAKARGYQ